MKVKVTRVSTEKENISDTQNIVITQSPTQLIDNISESKEQEENQNRSYNREMRAWVERRYNKDFLDMCEYSLKKRNRIDNEVENRYKEVLQTLEQYKEESTDAYEEPEQKEKWQWLIQGEQPKTLYCNMRNGEPVYSIYDETEELSLDNLSEDDFLSVIKEDIRNQVKDENGVKYNSIGFMRTQDGGKISVSDEREYADNRVRKNRVGNIGLYSEKNGVRKELSIKDLKDPDIKEEFDKAVSQKKTIDENADKEFDNVMKNIQAYKMNAIDLGKDPENNGEDWEWRLGAEADGHDALTSDKYIRFYKFNNELHYYLEDRQSSVSSVEISQEEFLDILKNDIRDKEYNKSGIKDSVIHSKELANGEKLVFTDVKNESKDRDSYKVGLNRLVFYRQDPDGKREKVTSEKANEIVNKTGVKKKDVQNKDEQKKDKVLIESRGER